MKNILIKAIVLLLLTGCTNKCKECPVYVYEGTVLNGNTLQPLSGCGVMISNTDVNGSLNRTFLTTTTDANGKYRFEFDCKTAMSKNYFKINAPMGSVGYYCSEFGGGVIGFNSL